MSFTTSMTTKVDSQRPIISPFLLNFSALYFHSQRRVRDKRKVQITRAKCWNFIIQNTVTGVFRMEIKHNSTGKYYRDATVPRLFCAFLCLPFLCQVLEENHQVQQQLSRIVCARSEARQFARVEPANKGWSATSPREMRGEKKARRRTISSPFVGRARARALYTCPGYSPPRKREVGETCLAATTIRVDTASLSCRTVVRTTSHTGSWIEL